MSARHTYTYIASFLRLATYVFVAFSVRFRYVLLHTCWSLCGHNFLLYFFVTLLRCVASRFVILFPNTMRCATLLYVTLRFVTLRYVTLHYITLRYATLRYVRQRYVMLCLITLWHVSLPCFSIRFVTISYATLHHVTLRFAQPQVRDRKGGDTRTLHPGGRREVEGGIAISVGGAGDEAQGRSDCGSEARGEG